MRKWFSLDVIGDTIVQQASGHAIAYPRETNTGLSTVADLNPDTEVPRLEMICTMTRPTTSSSIAALVSTTPSLVSVSPVVPRMVKVVARLVEHKAAPAAKAWRAEAPAIPLRAKDKAMGRQIPVSATNIDSTMFALRDGNEVESPPGTYQQVMEISVICSMLPSYTSRMSPR